MMDNNNGYLTQNDDDDFFCIDSGEEFVPASDPAPEASPSAEVNPPEEGSSEKLDVPEETPPEQPDVPDSYSSPGPQPLMDPGYINYTDDFDDEEPVAFSDDKSALLASLLPEDDKEISRLGMHTERAVPSLAKNNAPDVDESAEDDDELVSALQDMAAGIHSDLDDDEEDDEEILEFSADKQALLNSLMPDEAVSYADSEEDDADILEFSADKQALLNSLMPSEEERHQSGRYGSLDEDEVDAILPLQPVPEPKPEPKPKPVETHKVASAEVIGGEFEDHDEAHDIGSIGMAPTQAASGREPFVVPCKQVKEETIAGLTLWDDYATVCLMTARKGKLLVTHCGSIEFPEKAGDSERVKLIRALWKRSKIPTRSVWVSIHAPSLLQKYAMYDLDGEHLKATLMRDAEQSLQGIGGGAAVDWYMRPRAQGGVEGMIFAIPGWERDHYINMLRAAGLYVCGIGVPACDLARILEIARPYPDRKRRPAECVISFSRTCADIVIVYGMGSFYSRTVYSRVASWRDNMNYLYGCINDAINHYSGWIGNQPVSALLLTGDVPDMADLGGELLRETGIYAEIWNPLQESPHIEMAASARRSGLSGTMLAGSAGLAMVRD